MTTTRRAIAKGAWTAFLVLFAARAIACTPICDLSSQPGLPSSALPATAAQALAPHGAHDALTYRRPSPADQPPHNGDEQICEEPAYLSTQPISLSTIKGLPTVDAIPWLHAWHAKWKPALVATKAFLPRLAHPPPPRSPLDMSPRLRI